MRMPPLLADFVHVRGCKLKCEKFLTLPLRTVVFEIFVPKKLWSSMVKDEKTETGHPKQGGPFSSEKVSKTRILFVI